MTEHKTASDLRKMLKTPSTNINEHKHQPAPQPSYEEKTYLALNSISWQLKRIADMMERSNDL